MLFDLLFCLCIIIVNRENFNMKKTKNQKFIQEEIKDHHKILTDNIIQKLEESLESEKPWFSTSILPYNPTTGTKYKGVNFLSIALKDYNDPRFFTFKNMVDLSKEMDMPLHLKKGQKGITIFKALQKQIKIMDDEAGEEKVISYWTQMYSGTVFNATQIEGLPSLTEENRNFKPNEEAEKIINSMVNNTGLNIEYVEEGKVFYNNKRDTITIPKKERFKTEDLYYSHILHEVIKSTDANDRLVLENKIQYKDLIFELASYFLGSQIGIPYNSTIKENNKVQTEKYIEMLKKDKTLIFKASSKASKIVEYIIANKEMYYKEEVNQENKQEIKSKIKL